MNSKTGNTMKYPIGIQTFSEIITQGYVYVDKTEHVYNLAHGGKYYFLSRPRRFGKSLLVSTLDAYFSGKKELFKGLAIEKLEQDWAILPVIRLDLSGQNFSTKKNFHECMSYVFGRQEGAYGLDNKGEVESVRFNKLLQAAHDQTGKPVVILIDEYDKPIVDNLDNPELMDYCRQNLQSIYGVMKGNDAIIRMGFLTGVSKIGKLSVFSGLNNLMDISLMSRYNDICGISESELHKYFDEEIQAFAGKLKISKEECYGRLKEQYDGYRFSDEETEGIYNPFSLLNALYAKSIKDYWFETGTPTMLIKGLKKTDADLSCLENYMAKASVLSSANADSPDPVSLLFQSGYLTIKDYQPRRDAYVLGFPNGEVRNGFFDCLLANYVNQKADTSSNAIFDIEDCLMEGDAEGFMTRLSAFIANISYELQADVEKDLQNVLFVICELLTNDKIDIEAERRTSNGRIDLFIKTEKYIYIIEIKLDGTAEEALKQIEEKGYAAPFASDQRQIIKIGVNFDKDTRRLGEWVVVG